MKLYPHQEKAVERLKNGSVLVGGVGSGKSLTALYYWFHKIGENTPLYIITTARKRDEGDWLSEIKPFKSKTVPIIDSWNNVQKYIGVKNAFFIFDEQRIVSTGSWAKAFIKISRSNRWILLSATPGDTWSDYLALFIAHGFVKNKAEFHREYCVFSRFSKYPRIDRYLDEPKLERFRSQIVVVMKDQRKTKRHQRNVFCLYDKPLYLEAFKTRSNIFSGEPAKDAGEMCRVLREIVNRSPDKINNLVEIWLEHPKLIVFYNFDYELDILRDFCKKRSIPFGEWNGHNHTKIPRTKTWLYLCQYTAAAEGWNCITTDTVVFYSLSYSYKAMEQASGRIDRINTPFTDLYYYRLMTNSTIDKAINDALANKRNFNESTFTFDGGNNGKGKTKTRQTSESSEDFDSRAWASSGQLRRSRQSYWREQRRNL